MANKKNSPNKKTPYWFYIILILIPVLFVVLLEVLLRVFDYGYDYSQWVKPAENKYMLNPEYARRYFFATQNVPSSNGNVFDIVKKGNSYRIFILGESSGAGYPYSPNGDFGRFMKKYLQALYPDKEIEIVNLSMTAINSYTLKDLVPGVLEQKPDLILIYTGHNEYYGALGVGSMESLGTNRHIVNFVLSLNNFKITQLLRNTIKWAAGVFSSGEKKESGTLMSRMAQDQLIAYGSGKYYKGIEQFEGNMDDILAMIKDAGVPVILSTLASNLKDQAPFISVKSGKYPPAIEIYKNAKETLAAGDSIKANSLFHYAKDLDALRFRAPEEINKIIRRLAKKYGDYCVDADSLFNALSPGGITGDNLMTDHLHPVLQGYRMLAKLFLNKMIAVNLTPKEKPVEVNVEQMVDSTFYFTQLDSIMARYRIIALKNDWPYKKKSSTDEVLRQFNLTSYMDTVALQVIDGLNWAKAHEKAADYYWKRGNYAAYTNEMLAAADAFPFAKFFFDTPAERLLDKKEFNLVYKILFERYRYEPDANSAKWLGIIDLSRQKTQNAVKYLNESLLFDGRDAQVLFNLAGAYAMEKQFDEALRMINRCLEADISFPGADNLKAQLTAITGRK